MLYVTTVTKQCCMFGAHAPFLDAALEAVVSTLITAIDRASPVPVYLHASDASVNDFILSQKL